MSRKRAGKRSTERANMAKTWRKDPFFQKAKKEKYIARAVYKLEAIDKKQRIIKRGGRVLDLGCHPGSWMQYACKKVGPAGLVIGVDITPTDPPARNARTITADAFDLDPETFEYKEGGFDCVVSDMAPNTTGIKTVDQLKSAALVEKALEVAKVYCKPGGHFVAKIFMRPEEPKLFLEIRRYFENAIRFKPEASRSESFESYLVGLRRKSH